MLYSKFKGQLNILYEQVKLYSDLLITDLFEPYIYLPF